MIVAFSTDSALNDRRDIVGMLPDAEIETDDVRLVGRYVNGWMRRNGREMKGHTDATGRAILRRIKRGEIVNVAAGNGHILALMASDLVPGAGWEDSTEACEAHERAVMVTADVRRIEAAVDARREATAEIAAATVLTIEA